MGLTQMSKTVGSRLNDDIWHTVTYSRRGAILKLGIDDELPIIRKYATENIVFNFAHFVYIFRPNSGLGKFLGILQAVPGSHLASRHYKANSPEFEGKH